MNQPIAAAPIFSQTQQPIRGIAVPKLSRQEVVPLAREELTRFLALLDTLEPADWNKPTECTLWSVKDVVAHQASHVVALTRVGEFLDQFNPLTCLAYLRKGMNTLDAANQRQVDKRATWTPAQLIAEMRDNSETSFIRRQQMLSWLRWLPIGTPGFEGTVSLGEVIDHIFTRDMWMHRYDICRTTGHEMIQTPDHDGRITALMMRDLDQRLSAKLGGRTLIYCLTGKTGGEWKMGGNTAPATILTLDVFDLHRLASGRISQQQILKEGLVNIEGDQALGSLALQHTTVLY